MFTNLDAKEVAKKCGKSTRWVYQNAEELGGKKIAGSWMFTEEVLDYAIVGQVKEKMERESRVERAMSAVRLQNKARSSGLGKGDAGQASENNGDTGNPNRHGL
jgi:hypothetical protein